MRKVFVVCAVISCLPLIGAAQNHPRAEVFGGYTYLRGDFEANFHGWNASATGNLNNWFGVVGDFSGHYIDGASLHLFQGGPKFTFRGGDRVDLYVQTMIGAGRLSAGPVSDSTFAWTTGGGIDIKVRRNLAVRVFDVSYVLINNEGENAHNVRISTGLVFRFGGN